jgi:uncharacterized RDD family membrane protein YckC
MSVRIQTSQNVELEYEPASIGDRILANLLDRLIYVGWVLMWVLIYNGFGMKGDNSMFMIIATVALPIMLYPILTEYFLNGQTLGKRALNIRVVLLNGNQPTLGAYILRWLLILVDTEILTPMVAIITIAANGKGQRVGDIAAGTTVIKTTKRVSLSQVTYQSLPDDYQVTYANVTELNDQDIQTIRQVLQSRNEELFERTTEKVADVLGLPVPTEPRAFLWTVINDYTYLASKEAE